jgi:DNA-directed RNA polymerase specialized sigma24 family protein
MDEFKAFLKKQSPLCMGLPFYKELVSRNLYFLLAERSQTDFQGRNLFDKQCPNVAICDDSCRGRPVPRYKELEPLISKYDTEEGEWAGQPVWFLKVDTCKTCPFKPSCTKICPSMDAFHNKKRNSYDFKLDRAVSMDEVTEEWLEKLYEQDDEGEWTNRMQLTRDDIAWDCLSEPQTAAIMLVLVQGKTFDQAAEVKGTHKRTIQKSFESGMSRLKEYGLARRALKASRECDFAVDYYINGLNIQDIANKNHRSVGFVHQKLKEFRDKYEIST